MLRFFVVIIKNLLHLYMVPRMEYMAAHKERYSLEQRYRYALLAIKRMKRAGRIYTKGYGTENLPKEGGYVMFPNHQGLFDVLGFLETSPQPFTVVMKKEVENTILLKQVRILLKGQCMDRDDIRASLKVINQMTKEVKEGRNYLIFPEGTRSRNGNHLLDFKGGSFKSAVNAKCPIVPVAVIDSYKAFDTSSIKKLTVQIHYLKPLYYEDYKGMKTTEIAALVKERIEEIMREYASDWKEK